MNQLTVTKLHPAERRREAMQFRVLGLTYRQIVNAMTAKFGRDALPDSYDERNCRHDIEEHMRLATAITESSATEMRMLIVDRLDQLLMVAMQEALAGNLKAIEKCLKIEDMRAKLFGLYAPSQVKVSDWRTEIIELVKAGKLTREQVAKEVGEDVAREIFEQGSGSVVEGSFTQEESPKEGSQDDSTDN